MTFKVGDKVWDTLTRSEATIIGREEGEGVCGGGRRTYPRPLTGYYLDNEWAEGARLPWEISSLEKEGNA